MKRTELSVDNWKVGEQQQMKTNGRYSGFTLIELLVVIAIIALLAAILFPVFARARENARRASCQSNLKQIALGMHMYIQDYDEHYPGAYMDPIGIWPGLVFPYVKSNQIFTCPSRSNIKVVSYTSGDSGYSYNLMFTRKAGGANYLPFYATLSDVEKSAQTIIFQDAYLYADLNGVPCASEADNRFNSTEPSFTLFVAASNDGVSAISPHFDGENFAFADGHVKWMKCSAAYADRDLWRLTKQS